NRRRAEAWRNVSQTETGRRRGARGIAGPAAPLHVTTDVLARFIEVHARRPGSPGLFLAGKDWSWVLPSRRNRGCNLPPGRSRKPRSPIALRARSLTRKLPGTRPRLKSCGVQDWRASRNFPNKQQKGDIM